MNEQTATLKDKYIFSKKMKPVDPFIRIGGTAAMERREHSHG